MNPLLSTTEPFPGLRPFKPCEDYLFFGRERQIYTMVDRLEATRFLVVLGVSGSGKSSLVNCGLRPALHRGLMSSAGSYWRIVTARPGSSPVKNLLTAFENDIEVRLDEYILRNKELDETGKKKGGLLNAIAHARGELELRKENILIIIDQFEEVFRYMQQGILEKNEAHDFIQYIIEPSRQRRYPVYIAISMRSDFLGECSQFDWLPHAINTGGYLIPRLSEEDRRSVIRGPIKVVNPDLDVDEGLLSMLASELGEKPDQLTILQHALNRTWYYWKESGGTGPITTRHYQEAGKIEEAINQHADLVYDGLETERQRRLCDVIFKALTERGEDVRGIRRPMSYKALCELAEATLGSSDSAFSIAQEVKDIIYRFWKPGVNFLFASTDRMDECDDTHEPLLELNEDTFVDISHENLMEQWGRLNNWIQEETESSVRYRQLAKAARLHASKRADYLRNLDLQLAIDWRAKDQPNHVWALRYDSDYALAMQYLNESEQMRFAEQQEIRRAEREKLEAKEAQQKRTRVYNAILLVLTCAALGLGAWAIGERGDARENLARFRIAMTESPAWYDDQIWPTIEEFYEIDLSRFVLINPGTYQRGSYEGEENELPVHTAEITKPYYIGKYELTQGEWFKVMGTRPSRYSGANKPVDDVSWFAVQEFLDSLNAQRGCDRCFRLPTEAEWEYAALAGASTTYSFGTDTLDLLDYAWIDQNSNHVTNSVGLKKPNAFGLYDIYGNVWEWVEDPFGPYPSGKVFDPEGSVYVGYQTVKGGCFNTKPYHSRPAYRGFTDPKEHWESYGFRLVMEVD